MPPKKKKNTGSLADKARKAALSSPTPRIDRMQDRGMSRDEIRDRLNGENNQRDLSYQQLRAIGYNPTRIENILRNQNRSTAPRPSNGGGAGGGNAGGGAGGNGGAGGGAGAPAEQLDPMADYYAGLEEQRRQSAFGLMQSLLKQYGLESLSGRLQDLIQSGVTDEATITLTLQETDEWKQRFIGNERLKQLGLPVLSVGEYLATERSMAQIMRNFGLPEGFYDQPDDFGKFIGNAISPAELQDRVQAYSDLANRDDPAVKAQLKAMGMNDGDLIAFYMDPDRANPLIQRKYKATLIGASARRAGLETGTEYAERLAGMGITEQQAQAGYAAISEGLPTLDTLGDIYGVDYGQSDYEAEVFEGSGTAATKRKRLASRERAAFGGSAGGGGSLRRSSTGQF